MDKNVPSNAKNLILHSQVYAKGKIHIGDKYYLNGRLLDIPLQLNTIPFIEPTDVIGRDDDLKNIRQLLLTSDRVLLVNGLGGIGKTTVAKYIIATCRNTYEYIAWVDSTITIKEAFVNNIELVDSLALRSEMDSLARNELWLDDAFALIINRMRQLGGDHSSKKNLLIIDNASKDLEDTQTLDQIALRPNWKVLVTSREKLSGFEEYELGYLSIDNGLELFYKYFTSDRDDELVKDILKQIDYHTLLIELIAKTCQNLDWSLKKMLDHLTEIGVNISEKVNVKFSHNFNQKVQHIFQYLSEIFNLAELGDGEKYMMKQFAVLPSVYIVYEGNNDENIMKFLWGEKERKDRLTHYLNALVDKGWLQWDSQKDAFKMHQLIQEVTLSQLKPNTIDCVAPIAFIITKYKSLLDTFDSEIARFLPYSENLLKHLSDTDESLMKLANYDSMVNHRLGFINRSLKHAFIELEISENLSPSNIDDIAIACNSVAINYGRLGEIEKAIEYSAKALELKIQRWGEYHFKTAIYYDNLATAYTRIRDFENAIKYNEKSITILENNKGSKSIDLAIAYDNLAVLFQKKHEYSNAYICSMKALAIIDKLEDDVRLERAIIYHNISISLGSTERVQDALDYVFSSLDIRTKVLPENHFSIGESFQQIGSILPLFDSSRIQEAINYLEEAIKIYLLNFPENHPRVQESKEIIEMLNELSGMV